MIRKYNPFFYIMMEHNIIIMYRAPSGDTIFGTQHEVSYNVVCAPEIDCRTLTHTSENRGFWLLTSAYKYISDMLILLLESQLCHLFCGDCRSKRCQL